MSVFSRAGSSAQRMENRRGISGSGSLDVPFQRQLWPRTGARPTGTVKRRGASRGRFGRRNRCRSGSARCRLSRRPAVAFWTSRLPDFRRIGPARAAPEGSEQNPWPARPVTMAHARTRHAEQAAALRPKRMRRVWKRLGRGIGGGAGPLPCILGRSGRPVARLLRPGKGRDRPGIDPAGFAPQSCGHQRVGDRRRCAAPARGGKGPFQLLLGAVPRHTRRQEEPAGTNGKAVPWVGAMAVRGRSGPAGSS